MAEPVKLLTWNVAGRLTRLDEQADRAIAHACDVVCLQRSSRRRFRAALGDEAAAILCGDFNTPKYEARDGVVQTFAMRRAITRGCGQPSARGRGCGGVSDPRGQTQRTNADIRMPGAWIEHTNVYLPGLSSCTA